MDTQNYAYGIVACVCMAILSFFSALDGYLGICAGCYMFKGVRCRPRLTLAAPLWGSAPSSHPLVGRGQATYLGLLGEDPSKKCDAIAEEYDYTFSYTHQRLNEGPATRVIKVLYRVWFLFSSCAWVGSRGRAACRLDTGGRFSSTHPTRRCRRATR